MKELEDKIMAEVLHVIHDHEYSLNKVREVVKKCLEEAKNKGIDTGFNDGRNSMRGL